MLVTHMRIDLKTFDATSEDVEVNNLEDLRQSRWYYEDGVIYNLNEDDCEVYFEKVLTRKEKFLMVEKFWKSGKVSVQVLEKGRYKINIEVLQRSYRIYKNKVVVGQIEEVGQIFNRKSCKEEVIVTPLNFEMRNIDIRELLHGLKLTKKQDLQKLYSYCIDVMWSNILTCLEERVIYVGRNFGDEYDSYFVRKENLLINIVDREVKYGAGYTGIEKRLYDYERFRETHTFCGFVQSMDRCKVIEDIKGVLSSIVRENLVKYSYDIMAGELYKEEFSKMVYKGEGKIYFVRDNGEEFHGWLCEPEVYFESSTKRYVLVIPKSYDDKLMEKNIEKWFQSRGNIIVEVELKTNKYNYLGAYFDRMIKTDYYESDRDENTVFGKKYKKVALSGLTYKRKHIILESKKLKILQGKLPQYTLKESTDIKLLSDRLVIIVQNIPYEKWLSIDIDKATYIKEQLPRWKQEVFDKEMDKINNKAEEIGGMFI